MPTLWKSIGFGLLATAMGVALAYAYTEALLK